MDASAMKIQASSRSSKPDIKAALVGMTLEYPVTEVQSYSFITTLRSERRPAIQIQKGVIQVARTGQTFGWSIWSFIQSGGLKLEEAISC